MRLLTNWRNYVLTAAFMIALSLIFCEPAATDGATWFAVFAVTKSLGVAAGYAFYKLFTRWDSQGKLPEIKELFPDNI